MAEITDCTCVLAVNDLDLSRRFYCEKLGFTEDLAVDGWSFLSRGACKLRLGHCPEAEPISSCKDHSWFAYLHVDNVTGLYQEYTGNAVDMYQELEDKSWGLREFAVTTPDGHIIAFGEPSA
jgi:catechol 2,3-dioxygenase-like lactoylglutathione lyase family enzyme